MYYCNHILSVLLQAQTRVKLEFLDRLAKFWELQVCVHVCTYVCTIGNECTYVRTYAWDKMYAVYTYV